MPITEAKGARIYRKYVAGDKLTDAEVIYGRQLFKRAADALFGTGPVFSLAAKEANRLYLALDDIAEARKLQKMRGPLCR